MKRKFKIILIGLLCCMIPMIGTMKPSAVCAERRIYVVCPDGNCNTDVRDTGSQNCGSLYRLLRNLGLSEKQCQAICEKAGNCTQNKETAPLQPDPVPETTVTPTESPSQDPTQATVQTPTQATVQTPTQAPVQEPTENTTDSVETLSAYEQEVVRLVNEIRAQYGLSALNADAELSRVARIKSQDMRDNGYFSHNSPTYGTPFEMMQSFGIRYRTAGENIAMGYRTPQSVVDGWMNSEGHRKNILNTAFTKIGVGYVESGYYWTQMFIG